MRVVIADDAMLLREGVARLLEEMGVEVVGKVGDAQRLLGTVERERPDVAIVDIKMPPTYTDEGLVAAEEIRRTYPDIGVLVLSQYLESGYAMRLLQHHPGRVGYLLKERLSDMAVLADAMRRVCESECVIDPTIVARLLKHSRQRGLVDRLTEREREVLALMAQGRSNRGICEQLVLSPKTVEAHVSRIFDKLGLDSSANDHRRVLAVLTFLRTSRPG
jgi:DNA-binding NarL/FixJ family response regulator